MIDAADHAHGGHELRVDRRELRGSLGLAVEDARGEDAALVHDLHGRLAVAADAGEDDLALADDGVDVEDVAGDEALEEVEALAVAELFERAPDVVGGVHLFDADGGGFAARLEHPGRGDALHPLAAVRCGRGRG